MSTQSSLLEFIESVYTCMLSLCEGGTGFEDCIAEAIMSLHAIAHYHGIRLDLARILSETPLARPATELSEEEVNSLIQNLRLGKDVEETIYTIYCSLMKVLESRTIETVPTMEAQAIA